MKAVLVLDEMPKDCYDCPLSKEDTIYGEHVFICTGYDAEIEDLSSRADWCPLRPLPCKEPMRQMPSGVLEMGKRKRDFIIHKVDVINSYAEGRNEVIDEITGETE